jgi:predicted nucleic acid-binding protein
MLLVDSTVWIDYFNGQVTSQTNYLDQALAHEPILVGDLILVEVLQGFRSDADFESARQALFRFEQVSLVTPTLALQAARHYRTLRKQGLTVRKTIDCLIATYCLENGHVLLHSDADFDAFEQHLGLVVV